MVAIAVVRHVLCPPQTLQELLEATARGDLNLQESRRRRTLQPTGLRRLLKDWILA